MSSFLINSVTKLLTKTRKKLMRRPTKKESTRILNFMQWNRRRKMKQKEEMMANSMDYTKKKKTLKIYMEMWRLTKVVDETKWNVCRNEYKYIIWYHICAIVYWIEERHLLLTTHFTRTTAHTMCILNLNCESFLRDAHVYYYYIFQEQYKKKDCWRFHCKKNWLRKLHSSIDFFHIVVRAPNAHTILTFTKKKKQKN